MVAFREPQEQLTAIAGLAAKMRELPTTRDVEAAMNSASEAKLPDAIQFRSAVIQENIMQSMTVQWDERIAEITAYFAAQCAVASVGGQVSAAQAEWVSIKYKVASLLRDERSCRTGPVKLESLTLQVEQESNSDSLSSIGRSSTSEGSDLPEWATGPRKSNDSFHHRQPRRQALQIKCRSRNIGRAKI